MKTKGIALLLSLCLLIGLLPIAVADTENALPQIGDTIHGFVVTHRDMLPSPQAPTLLLTHQATGAEVYYVAADDANMVFDITFRTPAPDNSGISHAFEHVTMSGSRKYPSPNLFFPLSTQTFNTGMGATTHPLYTTYPISSLSNKQLLALADVYLDGVFYPLIYDEPLIFKREAWRYTLEDADAPLALSGTVYNEMSGAQSMTGQVRSNLLTQLYPGTMAGNAPGGTPEAIPSLTPEALIAYHKAYYHPSNSLTYLYGNVQLPDFLQLLDGYFSEFGPWDGPLHVDTYKKAKRAVVRKFDYPVEVNSPYGTSSHLSYAFALHDLSGLDMQTMQCIASLMQYRTSPLVRMFDKYAPSLSLSVELHWDIQMPCLEIQVVGHEGHESEAVMSLLEDSLALLAEDGFDSETVETLAHSYRLSLLTSYLAPSAGESILYAMLDGWARDGNVTYMQDLYAITNELVDMHASGALDEMMRRHIFENPHKAIISTVPKPGQLEPIKAQAQADLQAIRDAMTAEDVEALLDERVQLEAMTDKPPAAAMLAPLHVVDVASLPEEALDMNITDITEDGIRIVSAETDDVSYTLCGIALDVSSVTAEELVDLEVAISLLGMLRTRQYNMDTLGLRRNRYLPRFRTSLSSIHEQDEQQMMAMIQWLSLPGDAPASLALLREMIYETRFDDVDTIRNAIFGIRNDLRNTLDKSPQDILYSRTHAYFDNDSAVDAYLYSLDAYEILTDMLQLMQDNPKAVQRRLLHARNILKNRADAMAVFAGTAEQRDDFVQHLPTFFGDMPQKDRMPLDTSAYEIPKQREALIIDAALQSNMLYAPLEAMGLEPHGTYAPFALYMKDTFLMPKLRHALGVYGVNIHMGASGLEIVTISDPGIGATFDVLETLPDFLRNQNATQAELDGYIIRTYANASVPLAPIGTASLAINTYLNGIEAEDQLTMLREIKSFSPEDLAALADAMDVYFEVAARSTAGPKGMIERYVHLFDVVIDMQPE